MRIYVKVSPHSSQNVVQKISEGEYKIKLTAPPVDNQANEMLIKLVANYFDVAKSSVKILSGKTAKIKLLEIGKSV
ncbi:DUF167 domain-containing protein [Patescibacteria group bacterium]|nr:DUF167 domain-containing protein [Patescibacteria group bacterium]